MGSAFGELTVVVDARSVGRLAAVEEALRANDLPHRIVRAEVPGDGERLTRETLRSGSRFVVAVGGDDLINEVVNGMVDAGGDARPVLGIVPTGATNDVSLTFGLPTDPARACSHLTRHGTYATDIVRASVRGAVGERVERAFVNVATVGLWAAVGAREERSPAWLGRARRFVAFWRTIATFRPARVRVRADRKVYEGPAHTIVLGNCQFADDGMKLSPRSFPGDGVLDVQVFKGPVSDAYRLLWDLARGEHLPSPRVAELRARRLVEIDADRPLPVQLDGRVVGTTPAAFEIVPEAIQVKL